MKKASLQAQQLPSAACHVAKLVLIDIPRLYHANVDARFALAISNSTLADKFCCSSRPVRRRAGHLCRPPGNGQQQTSTCPLSRDTTLNLIQVGQLRDLSSYRPYRQQKDWRLRHLESSGTHLLLSRDKWTSGNVTYWQQRVINARNDGGSEAVWSLFKVMREKGLDEIFTRPHAGELCDLMLAAAVKDDTRIATLVMVAQQLYLKNGFRWPDIYLSVIHDCLKTGRYESAARWHFQLIPVFSPGLESYGALFSVFVIETKPGMQRTLTTLYICSAEKRLYDYIVPALFESGQSILARSWRRRLLLFKDLPTSSRAGPFLRFLTLYYPSIALSAEERLVAVRDDDWNPLSRGHVSVSSVASVPRPSPDWYSDTIVAKWLASSWAPVDLAINCINCLGLRVIGPRSLQSLALREACCSAVVARLTQLEKLGISLASRTYCVVLATFATQHMEELLADLLQSDIHPDEFDDAENRQMLLAASVQRGDGTRERLLRGVENVIGTKAPPSKLDVLLTNEVNKSGMGEYSLILDQMELQETSMSQTSAMLLLQRSFDKLGEHPREQARQTGVNSSWVLDRAVHVIRRVARHDVAVPLKFWKILVYILGRSGRFEELYQLCMEIVRGYASYCSGLIPVHGEDVPRRVVTDSSPDGGNGARRAGVGHDYAAESLLGGDEAFTNDAVLFEGLFTRRMAGRKDRASMLSGAHGPGRKIQNSNASEWARLYPGEAVAIHSIPVDLPFKHRHHPVQKLFDSRWQRSVVRWGFDITLALRPSGLTLRRMHGNNGLRAYDVACGVRLLALLRDQGVLVDEHIIRSAVMSRIGLGQVRGRRRHRSRDEHETSLTHLKDLVDDAWGSEILPHVLELASGLEKQKPKLWRRYPRLFKKAYQGTWTTDLALGKLASETNSAHGRTRLCGIIT